MRWFFLLEVGERSQLFFPVEGWRSWSFQRRKFIIEQNVCFSLKQQLWLKLFTKLYLTDFCTLLPWPTNTAHECLKQGRWERQLKKRTGKTEESWSRASFLHPPCVAVFSAIDVQCSGLCSHHICHCPGRTLASTVDVEICSFLYSFDLDTSTSNWVMTPHAII